ncbi:hypothetical protein HOY82DRAFT_544085 [Tuber indicum]|nr:hypothetical protein HOY82DRAFT_544085 [Tuber indicum]
MPASKSGLTCPRTKGHEGDGNIAWCKHICSFPDPSTTSPGYKTWRDAIKRRTEQNRIRGWKLATPDQWAAIQAYALTIEPLASNGRAALWQQNSNAGLRFTECLDFLLKDISRLGVAVPPAVPAAPAVATNDHRPSTFRRDNPLPRRLEHVPWKTHPVMVWVEMTEPTLKSLHMALDSCFAPGIGYRHLVGTTRYGSLLLLDSPEDLLPLSEMLVLHDDTQIRMWWGQCPPSEPMDMLFQRHRTNDQEPGTPPPLAYSYTDRNIRDSPAIGAGADEPRSEQEASLQSDSADDNDGQPECSATASRWGAYRATISTATAKQGMRYLAKSTTAAKPGPCRVATATPTRAKAVYSGRNLSGLDGVEYSSPDFAEIFVRNPSVDQEPDSEVIPRVAQGIPHSVPLPEGRVLSAPVDSSSKRNWAAMTDDEDSEPPVDTREPPRKIVRRNKTAPTGRNAKSGACNLAAALVQEPLHNASSPVSPLPSAGTSQVSTKDILIELGRSAERLPTDTSGAETASPTPSTSTPRDTAEDIAGYLRRSANHLLMVASGGQAALPEAQAESSIGCPMSGASKTALPLLFSSSGEECGSYSKYLYDLQPTYHVKPSGKHRGRGGSAYMLSRRRTSASSPQPISTQLQVGQASHHLSAWQGRVEDSMDSQDGEYNDNDSSEESMENLIGSDEEDDLGDYGAQRPITTEYEFGESQPSMLALSATPTDIRIGLPGQITPALRVSRTRFTVLNSSSSVDPSPAGSNIIPTPAGPFRAAVRDEQPPSSQLTGSRRNIAVAIELTIQSKAKELMWDWVLFVDPFPDPIRLTDQVHRCWSDARRKLDLHDFPDATTHSSNQD